METALYLGPAGAVKGLYNMLHGFIHTAIALLLTTGTLYAARYPVNLHDINVTRPHDLVIGVVYLVWLLFSLFAKQWLVTPEPIQTITTQVAPLQDPMAASGINA